MLEKPQRGLLENLNIVESVTLFDNRYCFTLENFKFTDKLKWINLYNQNTKTLLREFRYRKTHEILKTFCSAKFDCNPIIKTQIICQSREPPTELNAGVLGVVDIF